MRRDFITAGLDSIDKYKIFFSQSYSTNAIQYPTPILAKPNEVSTATFLRIGSFATEQEQSNCYSYMQTKFFKVLLYLGKGGIHITKDSFKLIPLQDFSHAWNDELLYKKYGLDSSEIAYIESMIKGM